jgi:putative endonuclease
MGTRFYCYILRCSDGTLYTGYTTDLDRRLKTHNSGKGAKYTRARRPCALVYYEEYPTKSEAMKREYAIKQLSRNQKLDIIQRGADNHV